MNLSFQENIDFMKALYEVIAALGKCKQFEQADVFYATVVPAQPDHYPLVIYAYPAPNADERGSRHILVAHYFYSHGQLRPYPEYVVTNLGRPIWMRTRVEFALVQPGDTSRNYLLEMWAKNLREIYVAAATSQRAEGKAEIQIIPEDEVRWIVMDVLYPPMRKWKREELPAYRRACMEAFTAFLANRDAAKSAFVQATYLELRDPPERLYLVCLSNGSWYTLSEQDLIQRRRWTRTHPGGSHEYTASFTLETVTQQRKWLYSQLNEQASGQYGGYVTDRRTLSEIACELGHNMHEFIVQEVDLYLNTLLDSMRHKKEWYERCYVQDSGDSDSTGAVL